MNKSNHFIRIAGFVCLGLALISLALAVCGHILAATDSAAFTKAQQASAKESAYRTASAKTAPSAVKKAASALSACETAVKDSAKALGDARKLLEEYRAGKPSDALSEEALSVSESLGSLAEGLDPDSAAALKEAASRLNASAESVLNAALREKYESAHKSVSTAEVRIETAASGVSSVYDALGTAYTAPGSVKTQKHSFSTADEYVRAIEELNARSSELLTLAQALTSEADAAQGAAETAQSALQQGLFSRVLLTIGTYPIGFSFTALLLAAIGAVAAFGASRFLQLWKKHPLFSTLMALLVMIVIQVYALGFRFGGYGEWGLYWLKNMLNVLRSNSSVGMIALGMTLVIITGGIDLAVGSNLAGVATVVMVCLDVSARGFLTGAGINGVPNFVIAICAGLLTGALLGTLTGLGITKGRIPPFIITLGIMNIVRAVAQYFTKSYKPEVPKAFQVIANAEIIGDQMLLPIIYWLVLAALMYIISVHTAFGRHVYAVGSNERAARLSGINTDRVKLGVYILMGVIVAIAAVTSVARLRGVDVASAGSGFEMNAIAAVVVGGTSMAGGRGSIVGTVFGVLIIGIMNNLLVLVGVDAFLSNAFTGAIIIFAVLIQKKDRQ